ncbi:MAG: tetratricopeptide repeat protein [Planctomycetota bacterium]
MMLYSDNRYPGPLEVEVELEMLDAYGVQPRAGLVIGYLPLLRSTEPFSGEQPHGRCFWIDPVRGWAGAGVVAGPTTIYAAPRQSRYTLRVKAWPGFYAVSINGQFVFQGQATPFQPDGYVGIGALSHSRSSNECRFENLRVRRLMLEPPPLNEPPAKRIAYFTNALRQYPDDEWALAMRGAAYQEQGEAEAAVADLTQVVDTEDPSPRFAILLALAHGQAGQYAEAMALFEQHLNGPAEMVASHGLAWLLATCPDERLRDGARAVTLAQKACKKVDYEDGDRLDTLAAAYAEQGNFEEAVRWQRKSIEFRKGRRGLNERRDRLKRYQGKQPYRLPALPAAPAGTSPGG